MWRRQGQQGQAEPGRGKLGGAGLAIGVFLLSGALAYIAATGSGAPTTHAQSQRGNQAQLGVAAPGDTPTDTPNILAATATAVPPAPSPTPLPAPTATAMAQSATVTFPCASATQIPGESMGWSLALCVQAPSASSSISVQITVCPSAAHPTLMSVSPIRLDSNGYWQDFDTNNSGLTLVSPGCAPPFQVQVDVSGTEVVNGGSVAVSGSVSVTAR